LVCPRSGPGYCRQSAVAICAALDGPALDRAKWNVIVTGRTVNSEQQAYVDSPDTLGFLGGDAEGATNGALVLQARWRQGYMSAEGRSYDFVSARLDTRGKVEFMHATVAARMKLTAGDGLWPAFWVLGTGRWPDTGEIDIMENVGFDPLRVHASVHTAAYNHTIGTQKTASTLVPDPAADFHVYAMEWYPDRIEAFVDGARYFSFRNEGTGSRSWPFDEPQYLLINLALGGAWGGQQGLDDSRFPHRYLVDYVRIYQQS
jgi:beta-glucanase (GH16 family)